MSKKNKPEIAINCVYKYLVNAKNLQPHPENNNKHSESQLERLEKILVYQGFRSPIVVEESTGLVVCGHARLEAAKRLGMEKVPVDYQEFLNEDQLYAHLTADNAIASWADLDLAAVNEKIGDMGPDFDVDLLGIAGFEIDVADRGIAEPSDNEYTKKIDPPTYEPSEYKPKLEDLTNWDKCNELIDEIKASKLDSKTKRFLTAAAYRHIVFDYSKIADFYAHSSKEMQGLMEASALVIIDFDKAIENNFIRLTEGIREVYLNE